MELCEPLETLVDLSASFYGYEGPRDTLTIITDSEKDSDPVLMGFKLLDDEEVPLFQKMLPVRKLTLMLHLRMRC